MPILTLNDIIKPSIMHFCTSFKDIDSRNVHVIKMHFFDSIRNSGFVKTDMVY